MADARQIDAQEFARLASAGRSAAESGNYRRAAELFGHALGLWRGPALVDVRMGRVLELEAMALEQSRLAVLGRRVNALSIRPSVQRPPKDESSGAWYREQRHVPAQDYQHAIHWRTWINFFRDIFVYWPVRFKICC